MIRTTEDWIDQYKKKNALWIHDGNHKRPHALLTSGRHSNGFFNSRLVIPDEALLNDAASDLLEKFIEQGGGIHDILGVVGPQTGATKLAELVSRKVIEQTMTECFWASPAKTEVDGQKSMVFNEGDLSLLPGQSVLLCEDVLTTGGSVELTANAVIKAGGRCLPYMLVLVNRSGLKAINLVHIVALIDHPMPMWTPEECPLCKQGSKALRPKDNWAELNASC